MPIERAVLTPYAMEKGPCAGDREIRMRPVPGLGSSRPLKEERADV